VSGAMIPTMPASRRPQGDPVSRAFAAYYRSGETVDPDKPASSSGVVTHQGKEYVVLRNVNGVLAVYRVGNSGVLRRLRRWPAAVAE
jgi:hypothetical protein